MTLQAHALGLGVCWIGHIDGERIQKAFKIKKEYLPVCILLMGYPNKEGEKKIRAIIKHIRRKQRKEKPPEASPAEIYKEGTFRNTFSKLEILINEIQKVKHQRERV
jgi:hypothetical protein